MLIVITFMFYCDSAVFLWLAGYIVLPGYALSPSSRM